jgi:hypothetical protein
MPMPRATASADDAKKTSSPSSRIWPCVGFSTPAMIFISVDLPAPFSPTSTLTAPLRTEKLARFTATVPE